MIDCDFPGGNILVEGIEGNTVRVRQDLRDTRGDWFYWYFRVRGAAGRTLTFEFTQSNVIGVRGPAVSTDGGQTWCWLGSDAVRGSSFRYTFPADADEVRFGLAMPYVQAHLDAFLRQHEGNPALRRDVLCRTPKGREVELLHVGRLDGKAPHKALLTCRHHCCEMMASYALEGILTTILSDTEDGQWLREHVEFLVVPFVDKDGVEDGDQGKNRFPRDHNRDYGPDSLYPTTRAIKELVPRWAEGRLRFTLDLHCPWIRGEYNEHIYFVGSENQENWQHVLGFARLLEQIQTGPLPYRVDGNLPFGQRWNTAANYHQGMSCARWAAGLPGIWAAMSIEIPYANVLGAPVTPESARLFGQDLARTMRRWLDAQDGREQP
jgi:hypothetical protein